MTTLSYTVPVAGTTLNSVADPEVATALSSIITWSSEIDTSNLSSTAGIIRSQLAGGFGNLAWNATATSTNAVDGNAYAVTVGSVTITLPTPTANRTVAVVSATASVVTIAASSGVIFGVGLSLSGVSSFTLGTPASHAVLVADGSNWWIIGGQQDTGWISLSLAGDKSATSSDYVPAYRIVGNMVTLRGNITSSGTSTTWATLPASARPAATVVLPAIVVNASGGFGAFGFINSSSGILGSNATPASSWTMNLDGLSYSLS